MHWTKLSLLALAASLACCGGDAAPAPAKRPNILLISLDSTRRDQLGCYGNRPKHAPELSPSPNLDALATRGLRFEQAYAPTSWTLPSHISLFTGESQLVHAVEVDANKLPANVPTLAELLKKSGYRTAGFVSGPYLEAGFGFARGFDTYRSCYGPELAAAVADCARIDKQWELASAPGGGGVSDALRDATLKAAEKMDRLSHLDLSSEAVTDAALAELRSAQAAGQPWLLFAHYFDPHYDYVAPAPHATRFDPDYTGPIDGRDVLESPAISSPDPSGPGKRKQSCSARDLEHLFALYDAEISWTDEQLGRLLQELRKLGIERDTLVIVTADHGDEFFEHGYLGHRKNLCEEVLQVPLLIAWPGHLPEGRAVGGLVSNVDVLPSVLELLDLPLPGKLSGQSFVALAQGRENGAARSVFARLVAFHMAQMAPLASRPNDRIPVQEVVVQEAYLTGSLKLVRERRWPRAHASAPKELREATSAIAELQKAKERLHWLDLGPARSEREDARSSDFASPAAQRALGEFRALYAEQTPRRVQAGLADKIAGMQQQLGALGYAGANATELGLSSDDYALPPPGEAAATGAGR